MALKYLINCRCETENGIENSKSGILCMEESKDCRQILAKLMAEAGIASIEELSIISGVSQLQIIRLKRGLLAKMQIDTVIKLAETLGLSVDGFLSVFSGKSSEREQKSDRQEIESLKQEYERLRKEIEVQKQNLDKQFQQNSIQQLESWLLQWPAAAAAAKKNSQLSGAKLLPLVKPVEKLLEKWGVEAIGEIGEELDYDPQFHQLIEGNANPGDRVKVRYLGYLHRDKLLYRAKVSPVKF